MKMHSAGEKGGSTDPMDPPKSATEFRVLIIEVDHLVITLFHCRESRGREWGTVRCTMNYPTKE